MEYLKKMKTIQNTMLEFLDDEEENQELFDDLSKLLNFQQEFPDINELKKILYLIYGISRDHQRKPFFFDKIKKIILLLKNEIKQTFSNAQIFRLFINNKAILLILIDESILTLDSNILQEIKYEEKFFYPEIIKNDDKYELSEEIPEFYDEIRRKGENNSYICELIRADNIEEFIIYVTKNLISLSTTIEPSIYETNSFLEIITPSLIEYAAFFGSIQIFRYLFQNQINLTPSLWLYAIHGRNPDIIHFLEENEIKPQDKTYQECLKESIKCYHNDFALYFQNKFIEKVDLKSNYYRNEICYAFQFYNFQFIPDDLDEKLCFYYAIEYKYIELIDYYYKNLKGLDINELIILNFYFHLISNKKNLNII